MTADDCRHDAVIFDQVIRRNASAALFSFRTQAVRDGPVESPRRIILPDASRSPFPPGTSGRNGASCRFPDCRIREHPGTARWHWIRTRRRVPEDWENVRGTTTNAGNQRFRALPRPRFSPRWRMEPSGVEMTAQSPAASPSFSAVSGCMVTSGSGTFLRALSICRCSE